MYLNLINFKVDNPELFNYTKNTVIFAKNVTFDSMTNISASKVIMGMNCYFMNDGGRIQLTNSVILGDGVKLKPCQCKKQKEYIVEMIIKGPCVIGNNSFVRAKTIGPNVVIGENCKIGEGSVINNNAVILDNSVVAPNSVIPSNCVFGGVPATFVSLLSEQAQS